MDIALGWCFLASIVLCSVLLFCTRKRDIKKLKDRLRQMESERNDALTKLSKYESTDKILEKEVND